MLHEFLFGSITSMGRNYYISLINPLVLLLLLLMIFVPFLHYFSYKDFKKNLQNNLGRWLVNIFIFVSTLIYILTKVEEDKVNILTIFIISICIILFLSNFYILKFGKYFLKNNLNKLPLFLGHLGLVIIIFGISWVSLFSIKKEFLLKKRREKGGSRLCN